MQPSSVERSGLGRFLDQSVVARLVEVALLPLVAGAVIAAGAPLAGTNPLAQQAVVWVANVVMLATVWLGLRLRGEGWSHLGLGTAELGLRAGWRLVWKSLVVFAAAITAFAIGSIVGANIVGIPEPSDLSGYNFLSGNLPLLLLSLAGVLVVSSLGEEIIYRGFLITRLSELGGGAAGLVSAVVVSAVVFGLVHYKWGPMGMLQTGFMGLALGIAYLAVRRNLWVLVLAHAYLDTILLVQMYFAPR